MWFKEIDENEKAEGAMPSGMAEKSGKLLICRFFPIVF